MTRADLHIHTYYSDGLFSPEEVADEAAVCGLNTVAVTDHDCILAYPEFAAACAEKGITAVSGTEISAYEKGVKIHTLGYGVNTESPILKQFMRELYNGSIKRAEDIICKLEKSGVKLTVEEIANKRHSENSPVHSIHIARAGAEKGYAQTPYSFYDRYLAIGKPAFSEVCRPSPETAIEVINASGGFASLAHPGRITLSKEDLFGLIKKLTACGLGGIEAVYSTHTVTETAYYKEIASTLNLVVTGGSDTHFKGGKKRIGSPVFCVDKALADKLKIEIR